jgi:hypothetical protein
MKKEKVHEVWFIVAINKRYNLSKYRSVPICIGIEVRRKKL